MSVLVLVTVLVEPGDNDGGSNPRHGAHSSGQGHVALPPSPIHCPHVGEVGLLSQKLKDVQQGCSSSGLHGLFGPSLQGLLHSLQGTDFIS